MFNKCPLTLVLTTFPLSLPLIFYPWRKGNLDALFRAEYSMVLFSTRWPVVGLLIQIALNTMQSVSKINFSGGIERCILMFGYKIKNLGHSFAMCFFKVILFGSYLGPMTAQLWGVAQFTVQGICVLSCGTRFKYSQKVSSYFYGIVLQLYQCTHSNSHSSHRVRFWCLSSLVSACM